MNSFWGNIFKNHRQQKEGLLTILEKIPIFQGLSRKELLAIKPHLHLREFDEGEVIFHQGDPGMGMYVIEQGTVKIVYEPADMVLAELADGEFFGELALLDEAPRSAAAIAKTPCRIWGLFQSDLFGLIERNPRLGVKITLALAKIIGKRLRHSNQELQALQQQLNSLNSTRAQEG